MENNDNSKWWVGIVIAIITVIIGPIVVWYVTKDDNNADPTVALHATQTQVAIEAAQAEIYATQTAIARLLNQPTPQIAPTNVVIVVTATPMPVVATDTPQQPIIECIHPQELARRKGWIDKGSTNDKWGGWYIELSKSDELPSMWEALGQKHIYQTDTDRILPPGRWAIYTPFTCREQFGFSN